MHQGIYIDIFPCDNLSDNKIIRKLQFVASKIVIAKSVYRRGYLTDSVLKKMFIQVSRLLPLKPFWKFVTNQRARDSNMVHTFFGGARNYQKMFIREDGLSILFNCPLKVVFSLYLRITMTY